MAKPGIIGTTEAPTRRWQLVPSLAGYRLEWLRHDLGAGLAIAAVGLPIALAYPAIAGLPPLVGLYASVAALCAYFLFGHSRQLIVGPDAATLTLLAAVMAAILAQSSAETAPDRTALAATLAFNVGVMCLLARLLGLGVLASFLSRPILTGFFAGISLSIIVGQIGRLTGLKIESSGLLRPLIETVARRAEIHLPTLAFGLAMVALLLGLKKVATRLPGPVIVVISAVILSGLLGLEARGIAVVGAITVGLPDLTLPRFSGLPIDLMILGSLALFLVSFGSGIVTARSFAARAGQDVDADRELVGFGMANIASGLIGGFAVTGADSRTAVNVDSGGRSQIAGLVAAAALLIMFFFFGDLLRLLPQPALGAILVVAAIGLIDVDEFHRLWYVSRVEFLFAMIAFLGPLAVGVLNGIVIAVCATLVFLLRKGMRPKIVSLGRIAGRDGFYKLHRTPDARRINGLEICLLQGNVLFFSADHVKSSLRDLTVSLPKDTRWLVLNAAGSAEFDYTGALALSQAVTDLQSRGIVIGFAELPAEAADLLKRAGVFDQVGESMVFLDLDDALRAFEATSDQTLAKAGDTHVMQTGSTKIAPSHG